MNRREFSSKQKNREAGDGEFYLKQHRGKQRGKGKEKQKTFRLVLQREIFIVLPDQL